MASFSPQASGHMPIIEYKGRHAFYSNSGRFPPRDIWWAHRLLKSVLVVHDQSYPIEPAYHGPTSKHCVSAAAILTGAGVVTLRASAAHNVST